MKKIALLLVFVLLSNIELLKSQTYFETQWVTENITYTGFCVYFSDEDAFMRINFVKDNQPIIAEYKCKGKQFKEKGYDGYLLDGIDATIIQGGEDQQYSADNFVFFKEGDAYGKPQIIDDQRLDKDEINFFDVAYWDEVSKDKFTKKYVRQFFLEEEPLYRSLLSTNVQEENYRITACSYGNDNWAMVMSQGSGIDGQTTGQDPNFPKEWIKKNWEDEYYITSCTYGEGQWLVVMSESIDFKNQAYKVVPDFPTDWIKEKWALDFYITSIAYGDGQWAVVMSKGTDYTDQEYKKYETFPTEYIKASWDKDFYVTSVAYGDGLWYVIMSKNSWLENQTYKKSATYPKDWIMEKGANDYLISNVIQANNEWLIVMTKGLQYTGQTLHQEETYPMDWVKEKWNVANEVQPAPTVQEQEQEEEEAVLEDFDDLNKDVTLHLIVVANTAISDIGESCEVDEEKIVRQFEIISDELGISFDKIEIDDKSFNKANVDKAVANLSPENNDIVIFFYSGHGFRWSNQVSKYPFLSMRYSDYTPINNTTTISLEEIYNNLKVKGARLTMVIGDCCNSDIGVTQRGGEISLSGKNQNEGKLARLQELFLKTKGNYIIAAASPGETSCGNAVDGGYLTSSFFQSLSQETSFMSQDPPSWETILDRSMKTASYKTKNLNGCSQQNGIFRSEK
ncbi:MAG: caspase family protein [Bacteroidetes bacterium]|jgi:hypothetical protein|nr:caspase family protein [Bacteroidota bacterium]MBK9353338.1 caspase family protein [Bacteroidota bacterium]MBL0286913.1 caspase family protein [Bacteroidota bacterium]